MSRGAFLVVLLVVLFLFSSIDYRKAHNFSCLECRMGMREAVVAGVFSSKTYLENECSEWFMNHDPKHVHAWRRYGCTSGSSLVGQSFTCHQQPPVFELPPAGQLVYLQSLTGEERQAFFNLVHSPRNVDQLRARDLVEKTWVARLKASQHAGGRALGEAMVLMGSSEEENPEFMAQHEGLGP